MDDDLLSQAFAAGAKSLNIHRFGREYTATLSAFRDLESQDGVEHIEHAAATGKGPTAALALREAIAKLRPTPAIEVREITHLRRVVPLALAESTTRVKGIRTPDPDPTPDPEPQYAPTPEPPDPEEHAPPAPLEPERAEAG